MGKTLKAAVIGCGGAGMMNHIPWYAGNPDVDLVGLVDINAGQAEQCAARWGGRAYADVTTMLDREGPDIVSIASPVHLHAEQSIECIDRGCHVLCEKPMAPTLRECRKMIDTAKKRGVTLGLMFDKRFSAVFLKMREIILSGAIGKPVFTRAHWAANMCGRWGTFRSNLCTGGGVFQDVGSHYLDLLRWCFDSEIDSVQGMTNICYPERSEVEEHAVALLTLSNGIQSLIETGWIGPQEVRYPHTEEFWVYGTAGAIKAIGAARWELPPLEIWNQANNEWRLVPVPIDVVTLDHYEFKRVINEFVSCVQQDQAFVPTGLDGMKAIEAVLALYAASYANQRVALPLEEEPDLCKIFARIRDESRERVRRFPSGKNQ